jgi:hypothetical protein
VSEPLSDEQLGEYAALAEKLAGRADTAPPGGFTSVEALGVVSIKALLAEVARLKAEHSDKFVRLVRAGEAVVRDADDDGDQCTVDTSRIKFLEDALDDIGPIGEEIP